MIQPKSVPNQYIYAPFSGGVFSSGGQIECERVLAPESREMVVVGKYGNFDHFD
ncbi:hypothetical protein PR002_g18195 [Phytophthora rubi]|uniref:Uncharacterized protein n=2 Tax=Phytophthora rubi TaxID=129364 RepID=A0A6A3K943_9STRA|nr:hypothetical protein PR002_g18195 [Phytophthora rubi]